MKEYIQVLARSPSSKKLYQTVYHIMEAVDPNYKAERANFDLNVLYLRHILRGKRAELLDKVLSAKEDQMELNLSFLVWLGIFQNYACYVDKNHAKFLDLEYEDIHQEAYMNSFIETHKAANLSIDLSNQLNRYENELIYNLTDYYCYLETIAYKFAHYAGFYLGNLILPRVLQDFIPDKMLTDRYTQTLKNYFHI